MVFSYNQQLSIVEPRNLNQQSWNETALLLAVSTFLKILVTIIPCLFNPIEEVTSKLEDSYKTKFEIMGRIY